MSLHRRFNSFIVASLAAGGWTIARPLQAQLTAQLPTQQTEKLAAKSPPAVVPPGSTVTFDDAISIALKQNMGVRQAENASELSDADVRQQKQQLLPDLRFSVSGSDALGRNFSQTDGAIVNQQTQSVSSGLSSSLTIWDGGKTQASIKSAQASADASESDLTRAKQTAVFTVASDYVALITDQEQLKVQQDNLTAQQAQLDLIQKMVDGGTRPVSDLYQQQATVASAKLAITQAKSAVELAKVDLIQALQLDPSGTYNFVAPTVTTADTSKSFNLDDLLAKAYANRPDLTAEQSRLAAAGQDVNAAKAARMPTISVTGGYSSAYSSASDIGFTNQLNQRQGGSIGLGVSIPIFDRGAASAAEQKAELAQQNQQLALDNEKQTVALEVRRAYLNEMSAKDQLAAAQAQLDAAKQAVDMTQKRYQAGAATLVEVTQAQAQQTQAASAVVSARYNLVLQQSVMSYYTGELDPAHVSLN